MTTSRMCQRWADRRQSWTLADPSERFDARNYEVHPVDEAAAKSFILRHHYLGSFPSAKRRYGLYRAAQLVGVAVYSVPAQAAVLTLPFPDLQPYTESIELGRLVLAEAEPGNTESWFVARCHEALYADGFRGVVSFADPMPRATADGTVITPGHVGWIYQALNATYAGRGTKRSLVMLPDGRTFSDLAAQKVRKQNQGHQYAERILTDLGATQLRDDEDPAAWLKTSLRTVGARRVQHKGCHRYLFPLGSTSRLRNRVRIGMDAQAFPKQADGSAL